jgi:hypothetical protein
MDPKYNSILTSILMIISSSVAAWAAGHGIVGTADEKNVADVFVLIASGAISAGLAWYKTWALSQKAMITAVNTTDNGVKVVASTSVSPTVTAPLKGPEAVPPVAVQKGT